MGFDEAFTQLIGSEGGYSNSSADPGGETQFGITKRVAVENGYMGDMKLLTLEQAKAIAKVKYWDLYHCDELPYEIAFQVFDAAYNGGYAVRWLQRAAGVTADGVIGPATIAAVKAADPDKIVMRFDADRLDYLADCVNWPAASKGWARRIAKNLRYAAQDI